jgi:hypothetical protein
MRDFAGTAVATLVLVAVLAFLARIAIGSGVLGS